MSDLSDRVMLETRSLRVVFQHRTVALDGVDLGIRTNEFVTVLGPSGAGKSTLLRCLNRLVTPTGGSLWFDGQDVTHASGRQTRWLRRQVGMIFQQFNLVGRLTALENVLAGRLAHAGFPVGTLLSSMRWFPGVERERALEALDRVGIADRAGQRADSLSGGQQQRVAIARLLVQEPRVILADEPIASLDPGSAKVVMDTLRLIHEEKRIPVLVNLHQPEIASEYSSRVIGMRHGRVLFDTSPDGITDGMRMELYKKVSQESAASAIAETKADRVQDKRVEVMVP